MTGNFLVKLFRPKESTVTPRQASSPQDKHCRPSEGWGLLDSGLRRNGGVIFGEALLPQRKHSRRKASTVTARQALSPQRRLGSLGFRPTPE
ncbi:hypothetical protein OAD57_01525 [Porticoccaceae bacterium]|nr:hypothetical protein [Porticoccaceae bacterium]